MENFHGEVAVSKILLIVLLLMKEVKPVLCDIDVLADNVVIVVDNLVKRLLATSGMTIGAPLRTRKQKAAKVLFYVLTKKNASFIS